MPNIVSLAEPLIRRVWLRMTEIYGHKWTSAFGDDAMAGAGETWAKALRDLNGAQLAVGIEACAVAVDPWPPTLPQFRAMCLGIPDLPTVIREMRAKGSQRSQFTALVWSYIDSYRYRQSTTEQADRQARDAYEMAREHVMRGGSLPERAAAEIGHAPEVRKPASDQVAREALALAASVIGVYNDFTTAADTTPCPTQAEPAPAMGHHAASAPRHGATNSDPIARTRKEG